MSQSSVNTLLGALIVGGAIVKAIAGSGSSSSYSSSDYSSNDYSDNYSEDNSDDDNETKTSVTKSNVMDYVESIKITEENDSWIAYWIEFTDYGYGTVWYHKNGGSKKWCDSFDSWLASCYLTKKEVIYKLYERKH